MATKSITVAEDAYEDLKTRKREGESFSDVIRREFGRRPLSEIAGVFSEESAETVAREVETVREEMEDDFERRVETVEEGLE